MQFEFPFVDLKIHERLFGLFDYPRAGMWPHLREGVKGMIFVLNPNPTSLSFWERWSFNKWKVIKALIKTQKVDLVYHLDNKLQEMSGGLCRVCDGANAYMWSAINLMGVMGGVVVFGDNRVLQVLDGGARRLSISCWLRNCEDIHLGALHGFMVLYRRRIKKVLGSSWGLLEVYGTILGVWFSTLTLVNSMGNGRRDIVHSNEKVLTGD